MQFKLIALIVLIALGVNCDDETEDKTIVLGDDDFSETIATNNFFVMFFAPWCGHCTRLKPTWSQLAELLNTAEDSRVKIAKVDCTEHQKTCSANDVTSYPTLKFFKLNSEEEAVKYRSTRDLPSLTQFINDQLGSSVSEAESTNEVVDVPAPLKGLIELTEQNFGAQTATGNWFVKFFAPWCGHCQKLAPTWEELASAVEHDPTVNIAKLDCTEYRPICKDFDVKGYPTLLWIENGKKIDKYSGPRTLEDLKAYVERRSAGEKPAEVEKVEPKEEGEGAAVVQLMTETFAKGIEKGVTFVKFYAPWCGHCKRMAPTWQQLAEKYVGNAEINVAKVDCTLQDNRDLCTEQQVNGFPTLFIYKDGEKLSEYNGSRSLEDLVDFIKTHVGSSDNARDEL